MKVKLTPWTACLTDFGHGNVLLEFRGYGRIAERPFDTVLEAEAWCVFQEIHIVERIGC